MPHIVDVLSQSIGLFLQCATLITVIYAFVKFTQKPTETLETRVKALEARADGMDMYKDSLEKRLHEGTVHFKANDESNRVTQNALVAIMDALGSSEVIPADARAEIKKRKSELMEYLTDR